MLKEALGPPVHVYSNFKVQQESLFVYTLSDALERSTKTAVTFFLDLESTFNGLCKMDQLIFCVHVDYEASLFLVDQVVALKMPSQPLVDNPFKCFAKAAEETDGSVARLFSCPFLS